MWEAERAWIKNFVFFIPVLGAETDEGASSLARAALRPTTVMITEA
jgi:hypothetical protein